MQRLEEASAKLEALGVKHASLQPEGLRRSVSVEDPPGVYYVRGDDEGIVDAGVRIQLIYLNVPMLKNFAEEIGWAIERIEALPCGGNRDVALSVIMTPAET